MAANSNPIVFGICLTRNPSNRLPMPRPERYEPARFGLARAYLKALGETARLNDFTRYFGAAERQNRYQQRRGVDESAGCELGVSGSELRAPAGDLGEHLTWAQGLLYFLANDTAVPERLRAEMNQWGLAKDEFPDTGHWPHQLYVREGRRMLGEYVLDTARLAGEPAQAEDSIGMGGYNIDVREVQWVVHDVYHFPAVRKEVLMEGYLCMPVEPYDIPYRALLPKRGQCENLLVTACISASSIAYASFRMEPQYMIAGHAAGVAAAQAIRTKTPLAKIDVVGLQERLRKQKQIVSLP